MLFKDSMNSSEILKFLIKAILLLGAAAVGYVFAALGQKLVRSSLAKYP